MAISSIGVGSGLPLEDLLGNLRNSENTALALIQSKQITAQNRLSAYGKIQSSLEALQTAGKALTNADTYGAMKNSVGTDAVSVSVSNKAIAGKYNITVGELATSQTIVAKGQADRTTAVGAGGIVTFTLGDGTKKELDLTGKDSSIDGLISAINSDPDLGIQATVINDGTASPYRLMLTATTTGTDSAITSIEVSKSNGTDSDNQALETLIGFSASDANADLEIQAAKNGQVTLNGITITSQTNTLENAIEGVTLTLNKVDTTGGALTITRDDSAAEKAVNAFVTAYNNLQNTIKSLTSYDVANQSSSALTGDSLARRVQSQVRDVLNASASTASGSIRSLSQIGITTDHATGTLKVDSTKLAAALKDNLADVQGLLGGDGGISKKLEQVADGFLKSGGLISAAKDGANRAIEDLRDQYDATSERIDAKMATYRAQFTALDGLVAQMNSTSAYLTQQLSMLGNMNKE